MGMRDLVIGILKKHEEIEILGVAKNDEEEIQLIENLKLAKKKRNIYNH